MITQFGGRISAKLIERYSQSPHWHDGKFQNLQATTTAFSLQKLPGLLYRQICKGEGRYPVKPLPVMGFDKKKFLEPSDEIKIIWYGHSAVLMRINNTTLLIDPMLGPDAAPTAPFKIRRFSPHTLDIIDDLPPIDLVLLTHDHYDHLDLASMRKLKSKAQHYFVALGVARHLISWGIDDKLITEFDWWQQREFNDIAITFTPGRHFSGRGLSDRFKSLWGGWVFETKAENVYFSGDSGYGKHFKEVGKRLGPFDFGMVECGQYNENWHQIHMYPEESVQAALDARVEKAMAVHWGAFALAQHHWKDPITRFVTEAAKSNKSILTPQPGELFSISKTITSDWWNAFE
ncbi:MAG TPA: MBL fold metallo-hydrolase [Cyclobacteriaceae bacterium]|nr:MBL fold metallo-hydrolase [Cyclobacteriaceae bacterium]